MNELAKTRDDSSVSSVDPDTDEDPDDELFGTNSDNALIASNLSDTHIEDITELISCIDLTNVNHNEGYENLKTMNLVLCKYYLIP